MRYRKLDKNDDYSFGRGQEDFWHNVPDAPGQAVLTRLRLWTDEWFLNLADGTPYNTKVLGFYTGATRDVVIRDRILGTPGVTGLRNYSGNLNRENRVLGINVIVDTVYGAFLVAGPI